MASLWFETDSLWERTRVCLLDYVSNTLYPRQHHVYEGFGEELKNVKKLTEYSESDKKIPKGKEAEKKIVLKKEEEAIFQEVLSDFLGSST